MGTGWWVALGLVVLLALVAALVDGTGRLGRPGGRSGPRRRRDGDGDGPR